MILWLLVVILGVLKLTAVINISWFWVLAPLWIPIVLAIIMFCFFFLIGSAVFILGLVFK